MTKIGGIKHDGLFTRESTGDKPYFIFRNHQEPIPAGRPGCW
jgi:hypothetical protein